MDLGLREQVVLVTGSSSGIGRAAAIAFGREAARVGVTYHRNQAGAEETADRVREAGGQALVLHYDLTDPSSIRSSIERIQQVWGALGVLINNAVLMDHPGPTGQPFEDVPLENWQSMLRSTLEGTV